MQQPNVSGPGPEVSVVIPTRNRWRLLEARGLASALCQQDVSLEVVVVDDGSTDETPRRLASLNDDRVRTIRNERGTGVARARNSGMAAARGEWIAFLDDDDIWAPRKLRLQLDAAAQTSADFVYAGVAHLDDELRVLATFAPPAPDRVHQALIAGISLPAGASNVLARRRVLDEVGGFDPELRCLEDHEYWLRLAAVAPAASLGDVLVGYVQHAGAAHLTDTAGVVSSFRTYARRPAAQTDLGAVQRMESRYLHWIAGQHRRSGHRRRATAVYMRAALSSRRPHYVLLGLEQIVR